MKTNMMIRGFACLAMASLMSPVTAKDATEPTARVERVYGTPVAYTREGDSFRRVGPLPDGTRLQRARIVDSAPGGYVLVETADGPVWIDRLNVWVSGALPEARCGAFVTSTSDSLHAGVRGAGEGCP